MKLPDATETTGGRFHRIRSSAAVKSAGAPQVGGFSHGLGQNRTLREAAAMRAANGSPLAWFYCFCDVPTVLSGVPIAALCSGGKGSSLKVSLSILPVNLNGES